MIMEHVVYKGDAYCWDCGTVIENNLLDKEPEKSDLALSNDSNIWPQWVATDQCYEDAPVHCHNGDKCLQAIADFSDPTKRVGGLIQVNLTQDGKNYVVEKITNADPKSWSNLLCNLEWYHAYSDEIEVPTRFATVQSAINWAECMAYYESDEQYYVVAAEGDQSENPYRVMESWHFGIDQSEIDDDTRVGYVYAVVYYEYPRIHIKEFEDGYMCEFAEE